MMPLTRHLPPSWILSIVRSEMLRGYVDPEKGAHDVDVYLRPFLDESGRDALMHHLEALDASETETLGARLKDIVSPTTILWGEHDPFLPVSVAARLRAAIRGSTLEVVQGGRHFLPEESAQTVAAAITKLLLRS